MLDTTSEKVVEAVATTGTVVVAGWVLWEISKWGVAVVLAPETGGTSFLAAGALP